ncbi:MAG: thioredoxin family protein [Actinomycetota bacterium]|nr:thioredoxin family protein [Actinomycetota bacterium]
MTLSTEESDRSPVPPSVPPRLLVFGCESSPCCRATRESIERFRERHTGHVVVRHIDVGDNPQTSVDHSVLTVPTVILEIAGREVARLKGYASARRLVLRFEPLLYDDLLHRIRGA